MLPKNNGITDNEILQNQFTAYVRRAVHNCRLRYITTQVRRDCRELNFSQIQVILIAENDPIEKALECEYPGCLTPCPKHRTVNYPGSGNRRKVFWHDCRGNGADL